MIRSGQVYTPGQGGGVSLYETAPGSGAAPPIGVENVLEYNGLLLNTKWSADRYDVNSIDGLFDADIRDTRDVNSDQHGETPFASYYGGRTIVINGTIRTYSVDKLRDMQIALKGAFADLSRERMLHFRTGDFSRDVVIGCKKLAPLSGIEQQANRQANRDFQITLRASNPRFLAYYISSFEIQQVPTVDWVPAGVIKSHGNFEAQPIVRFYGPMTNANIYNDATSEALRVLSIGGNDYLEFDMAKRTLKNRMGINMWSRLADTSSYLTIAPGDNFLLYAGDTSRIQIRWRDSYM